jgi:hypothetical protein
LVIFQFHVIRPDTGTANDKGAKKKQSSSRKKDREAIALSEFSNDNSINTFGRDTTLSLFHSLAKILHCKSMNRLTYKE